MTLDPQAFRNLSRYLAPSAGGEFADRALAENLIRPEDLEECLKEQERSGMALDRILVSRGLISPEVADRLRGPVLPPEAAAALKDPARSVDKYVLVSLLGRGGTAEVWKAWDRKLSRWIALKLLKAEVGHGTRRIEREGKAAGGLLHPNIIPVYEVGQHAGRPYLAMALVEGKPVSAPLPLAQAIAIIRQIASALEAVHGAGLIHRDVKPGNIILENGGRALLGDFGLAQEEGDAPSSGSSLTGTPQFASPEQLAGDMLDPRTDIYSLGATLFHLLAGRPPYRGAAPDEIARAQQERRREPLPRMPARLRSVLERSMALARDDRYASVTEFSEDLEKLDETLRPGTLRKPSLLMTLGLAAVISSAATYAWLNASRARTDRQKAVESFLEGSDLLMHAQHALIAGPGLRPAESRDWITRAMPAFLSALWLTGEKYPEANAGLGRCFELMAQYDRARLTYEQCADVPEARRGRIRLAARSFLEGRKDRDWKKFGLELLEREESPSSSATVELIRRFWRGSWTEAIREGKRAEVLEPSSDLVLMLLGWSAREAGQAQDAIRWTEEAHRLRGEDPLVWYQLGRCYLSQGRRPEARKALSRALQLADPGWSFLPETAALESQVEK